MVAVVLESIYHTEENTEHYRLEFVIIVEHDGIFPQRFVSKFTKECVFWGF